MQETPRRGRSAKHIHAPTSKTQKPCRNTCTPKEGAMITSTETSVPACSCRARKVPTSSPRQGPSPSPIQEGSVQLVPDTDEFR